MIFPVKITTRNRSSDSQYVSKFIDSMFEQLSATNFNIITNGVKIISNRGENRLAFSKNVFGKIERGSIINVDVEYTIEFHNWKNTNYDITFRLSGSEYSFNEANQEFQNMLSLNPALMRMNFDYSLDEAEVDDDIEFGLFIRGDRREDLYSR